MGANCCASRWDKISLTGARLSGEWIPPEFTSHFFQGTIFTRYYANPRWVEMKDVPDDVLEPALWWETNSVGEMPSTAITSGTKVTKRRIFRRTNKFLS